MDTIQATIATLPVSDQQRADAFYQEILGYKPSDKNMPGGSVMTGQDGTEIFLYRTESSSGEATRLSLSVKDFDEFVQTLVENNVSLESYEGMPGETDRQGVYEFEGSKVAWFKDSEGNVLNIFGV